MNLQTLVGPEFKTEISPDITGITCDSREVSEGFLFAALPGSVVDGAKFVPKAVQNGAAAILVSEEVDIEVPDHVPVLRSLNPRQSYAKFAARFYKDQPKNCVAVTGTNGKTSVASFVRQIWLGLGYKAASLGTIGLVTDTENVASSHTTPEPVALHKMLAGLAQDDIHHLAVEASSHGLQQHRLDGVCLKAGAFTNISRDHLDYHSSFEDYFTQKLRLFSQLLPSGSSAVVDADSVGADRVIETAKARSLNIISVGSKGDTLRLEDVISEEGSQTLMVVYKGTSYKIRLPLVGHFQASNALVAAGLCLSLGEEVEKVFAQLETLKGARGRLEKVAVTSKGAGVFIDYAHTPDALETALLALRPYVQNRLIVLFGCGGDRDKGKRPEMGKIAQESADIAYVCDDNPRGEDAAQIRAEILQAMDAGIEIGDRQTAITDALNIAENGDIVLVAGKGHETGQIVGDQVLPFSDHEAVEKALEG